MTVSQLITRDFAESALTAEAALHHAQSIVEVLAIRAGAHPDEIALLDVTRETAVTYGELHERAGIVAAAMTAAGVARGDILALPIDTDLTTHAVVHHAAYVVGARPMVVGTLKDLADAPADAARVVDIAVPNAPTYQLSVVDAAYLGCADAAASDDPGDALYDERTRTAVLRTAASLRQTFAPGWPKLLPMLRGMAYTVEPASFGSALLWQFWRGRGGYLVADGGVDALVAVVEKYGLGAVVLTKSQYRSLNEVTGFERDVTTVKEVDITSLTRVSKVDNERISALFPQASPAAAPAMDGRLRLLAARTGAATPQTPVSANTPAPSERVAELSDLMGEVGASYVELLVGVLTRWAFDHEYVPAVGGEQYRKVAIDRQARAIGRDWPADAETMVGVHRLRHLAACVAQLVRDGVPGDLLEAGVWRGGSCMVMRAALRAMGEESKTIWAADSYAGFPEQDFTLAAAVDAEDTCAYRFPLISVGLPVVQRNFERYGLLDDRVRFVPGWFHETLPGLDVGELALLRVDGDLYDSTWAPLDAMYPKLAVGGYCIVDDYGDVSACRDAVDEYRRVHGITEPIQWIDTDAVYWRKTR